MRGNCSFIILFGSLIHFGFAYANLYEWQCERIIGFNAPIASFASLDLDSNEYPHLVYTVTDWSGFNGLEHAYKSTTGWQEGQLIDTTVYGYPSVALDKFDFIHICYVGSTGLLKYAYWNGESLMIETVDDSCNCYCHIVVDTMCHPHISYRAEPRLKYAVKSDSQWRTVTVDSHSTIGINNAIFLDGAGNPHIVYVNYYASELWYSFYDGSTWFNELIVPWFPYHPGCVSLCLDSLDNPHISFINGQGSPTGHLMYAFRTQDADWQIDTVNTDYNGAFTSIALDNLGTPCIVYYLDDMGYYWLSFAIKREFGWHIEPVDTMDWNHPFYSDNELVLTFNCNNEPHIAYGTGNDRTTYAHGVRLGIEEESNNLGSHNFFIIPNPFTVSVNIEYELLTAEYVTLRI